MPWPRPSASGILDGLVVTAVVLGAPVVLGYYARAYVYWPFAVGFAIALLAVGIYIAGKFLAYRRGLPMSNKAIERKLKEWAEANNYAIRGNPQAKVRFAFILEDEHKRFINILRTEDEPDLLWFMCPVNIKQEHQDAFRALPIDDQEAVTDSLVSEFARLPISFKLGELPVRFEVSRSVVLRGIGSRMDFLNELGLIRKAMGMVLHRMERAVRRAERRSKAST
jgi:hypothetical protein